MKNVFPAKRFLCSRRQNEKRTAGGDWLKSITDWHQKPTDSLRRHEGERKLCTGKNEFFLPFLGHQPMPSIPNRRRSVGRVQD